MATNDAVKNSVELAPEADNALFPEMNEAGVIYGRKRSILHPSAQKYISGVRGAIVLFDLAKTLIALEAAAKALKDVIEKKGTVMVIGAKPGFKEIVVEFATKNKFLYVINRWLGGTLTNFKSLSGRLQYYLKLRHDFETGKYEKYPKKERTKLQTDLNKLSIKWTGLESLAKLPDALLIIDSNEHNTAFREAKRLKIPVVAIANSNTNFDEIDYPIPANSNAPSSVKWILNYIDKGLNQK